MLKAVREAIRISDRNTYVWRDAKADLDRLQAVVEAAQAVVDDFKVYEKHYADGPVPFPLISRKRLEALDVALGEGGGGDAPPARPRNFAEWNPVAFMDVVRFLYDRGVRMYRTYSDGDDKRLYLEGAPLWTLCEEFEEQHVGSQRERQNSREAL